MGHSDVLILHGLTHIACDYLTECKKDARKNPTYYRRLHVQNAQHEVDTRVNRARSAFTVINGDKK